MKTTFEGWIPNGTSDAFRFWSGRILLLMPPSANMRPSHWGRAFWGGSFRPRTLMLLRILNRMNCFMRLRSVGCIFVAALYWGIVSASAANITVFAAASLTDGLKEIATGYEKESGERVTFNFGASSTLARQIEAGAPADIFFSADEAKMDSLEAKGLIVKETRKSQLSNSLVIIVAAEGGADVHEPRDLASAKAKRIALGDPKAVPIGVYAREYLEKLGLWAAIEPKVVATENVRAALAAVEAGNADASIVYKTDAAISRKVRVAYTVPREEGPKISYPTALLKDSKQREAAIKFLDYLGSETAGKIFHQYGFLLPP
jgi:molybdate transport system substrate-binding protein